MLLGATLSVAALLSACGSSDDESGDAGLSESDLLTQANAICKTHTDKISAATNELIAGGEVPTPETLGKLAQETIIPEESAQVQELRALQPPSDLAESYGSWLDDSDALLAELEQDPSALTDPQTFASVNQQADELGLSSDCQAGPS